MSEPRNERAVAERAGLPEPRLVESVPVVEPVPVVESVPVVEPVRAELQRVAAVK
jgi:hypothetical protein